MRARLYLVLSTQYCNCRLARLSPTLSCGLLAKRHHLSPVYLQCPAPTQGVLDSIRMHKCLKAFFKLSSTKYSGSMVATSFDDAVYKLFPQQGLHFLLPQAHHGMQPAAGVPARQLAYTCQLILRRLWWSPRVLGVPLKTFSESSKSE